MGTECLCLDAFCPKKGLFYRKKIFFTIKSTFFSENFLYIKNRREKKRFMKFGEFMAEDLQTLIDHIQKEAVDKADATSASIIAKAKEEAARIVKDAEAAAASKLEQAEKDSQVYTERSERALNQAARDVLISVGRRFEKMVSDILSLQVEKSLSAETVKEMLLALSKNYNSDLTVVFSDADKAKLASFATGELAKSLGKGVTVESDSGIKFGFRIQLENGKISHEFTSQEIANALSALVRPQIAKIVSDAAQGK